MDLARQIAMELLDIQAVYLRPKQVKLQKKRSYKRRLIQI